MAAHIFVLAGCNGAGKSSVLGAHIEAHDGVYFNPDRVAQSFFDADPSATQIDSVKYTVKLFDAALARSLESGTDFAFETTLSSHRVRRALEDARARGARITLQFVGVGSAQTCKERIALRVAEGGHPVRDEDVERRYESVPSNLASLLPVITTVRVFDNDDSGIREGQLRPRPRLILAAHDGALVFSEDRDVAPRWSHRIIDRAVELFAIT